MNAWPTQEDISLVVSYTEDARKTDPAAVDKLDKPERFVYEVSERVDAEPLLRVWCLRDSVVELCNSISHQCSMLNKACQTIIRSEALKSFLAVILTLGNTMNRGSAVGNALGFDISILNSLSAIKSNDNSCSLLSFALGLAECHAPQSFNIPLELQSLSTLPPFAVANLRKDAQQMSLKSSLVENISLSQSCSDQAVKNNFHRMAKEITGAAAAAKANFDAAEESNRNLALFYGRSERDLDSFDTDAFFTSLSTFVSEFKIERENRIREKSHQNKPDSAGAAGAKKRPKTNQGASSNRCNPLIVTVLFSLLLQLPKALRKRWPRCRCRVLSATLFIREQHLDLFVILPLPFNSVHFVSFLVNLNPCLIVLQSGDDAASHQKFRR
jgi:formin 2